MDLAAIVVRRQLESVVGGPQYGTDFSFADACVSCGTGAEQSGPLRLRRFRVPRHQAFVTLDYEVLLQADVAAQLRAAGVVQCLRPVLDAETGRELEVVQLVPMATLPPFHSTSRGITREGSCQMCNRDGYYGLPKESYRLHYEELSPAFRGLDLLATFERFGVSRLRDPMRNSNLAVPVLIAGGQLLAVLTALSLRDVELQEVTVEWGAGERGDGADEGHAR